MRVCAYVPVIFRRARTFLKKEKKIKKKRKKKEIETNYKMPAKCFKGAPFGTQKQRFETAGMHPDWKFPGTYTEFPHCTKLLNESIRRGPGAYLLDLSSFGEKAFIEKCSGPGWGRALQTEKQAKIPHMLYKKEWEKKRLLKTKLGPGTYESKEFMYDLERKPGSIYGVCETQAERFPTDQKATAIPGPGTYKPKPTSREEKEKTCFGSVGMIDARMPREGEKQNENPGPGTYQLKSEVDSLLEKVVSLRGPFDLFTGDRSYPLTTGHYALGKRVNLGPGQYELKPPLDHQNSAEKSKHGKFAKIDRFPYPPTDRIFWTADSTYPKNPTFPGPGTYNPKFPTKPPTKYVAPFWTAAKRNDKRSQKAFMCNYNMLAPDRYDLQRYQDSQYKNGHESVFDSKTGPLSMKKFNLMQERIRPRLKSALPVSHDAHSSYGVQRALTIM